MSAPLRAVSDLLLDDQVDLWLDDVSLDVIGEDPVAVAFSAVQAYRLLQSSLGRRSKPLKPNLVAPRRPSISYTGLTSLRLLTWLRTLVSTMPRAAGDASPLLLSAFKPALADFGICVSFASLAVSADSVFSRPLSLPLASNPKP